MISLCLFEDNVRVDANSWISLRTIEMPRSSDALSSSVMASTCLPYICLAIARIVDVLPVPGGP